MRLIFQDPKTGILKLRIETPSDLWRIARLVRKGERIGASTTRRDPEVPLDTPAAQRARRRIWLVLTAEQIEFHGFSHRVRITGPIVEAPFDVGRHHTLDLGEGDEVELRKESLSAGERALLEEGMRGQGEPVALLASVDWGESTIVRLRGRAIETVADLDRTISGKRYRGGTGEKDRASYLAELAKLVAGEGAKAEAIVLSGPGFLKEHLGKAIAEIDRRLTGKVKIVATGESGRAGIDELLRSGRASEALRGAVAAEESELVEALVTALAGGQRAAVGPAEVEEAAAGGAVETLLVSESLLEDAKVGATLEAARSDRARVLVVRDEGPGGARLAALGGIGALLRYDWSPVKGRPGRSTGSTGSPRAAPRSGA